MILVYNIFNKLLFFYFILFLFYKKGEEKRNR